VKSSNRLAAVMAELDAERRPEPEKPARKAKPKRKAEPRRVTISYLLETNGRIVDFEVHVSTEEPKPAPGWSGPMLTPVGWFMTRIVQ